MDILEYILDGLEKALELERELGVRSVEIDRGLLGAEVGRPVLRPPQPTSNAVSLVRPPVNPTIQQSNNQTILPVVFLHDRPLSPAGVEMLAKILNALGKPDAPIVVVPPVPEAKVTVVLGGLALKKYFPGMKGEPGQWQKTPEGRDVLITYSPAYILRFGTVTPAVQKIKQDMWLSLKAVKQRLAVSG
ncbi:MAG: hypothetical protein KBT68_09075 [bacterium]|nr:hypothetical protein [Candidatus Colisoma equi]